MKRKQVVGNRLAAMKKVRLVLTLTALAGATLILLVSLSSASVGVGQASSDTFNQSQKQLYFSEDMLPDHVAYPVLMAVDRVRLESVAPVEQVYLKTAYANRRLQYAEALLEKDNQSLAVSTLTKAQKYLLSAAQQVVDHDMPDSVTKHVIATLEYHQEKTTELAPQLDDNERAIVDGLNEEAGVKAQQLQSRLDS